jgi:RNA polymerase sigma-70 factor (ECF subfamily)
MTTEPSASAALEAFEAARPKLFAIAYRMTGSVADAEDLCQETWLRWERAPRADVLAPEGWLVRTVTNLAIDRSRTAHHRRETYVGPYLPEPLVTDFAGHGTDGRDGGSDSVAEQAELADSLTFAFLVLLDELDPTSRAVFLLHDVFGYSFPDIAVAVDRTPASCRQIASRARKRIAARRVEIRRATIEHERRVVDQLVVALMEGDVDAVVGLLAPDVLQLDDGGPRRRAARRPIVGPERCARLLVNLAKRLAPDAVVDLVRVNGAPGVVVRAGGHPQLVLSLELGPDGRIARIWSQLNPDKLRHVH